MLAHRLTEYIGSVDDDRHSCIWRSAVEEHEQDAYKDGSRDILVDAVRDAALGATGTGSAAALAVAKSLLQSPYPTLTRVGIYVCGEHYGNVGTAFWECAKASWFVDVSYWHELFLFINKGFSKFSSAQRAMFLEFVEQLQGDWSDASRQVELDETQRRDLLHPAYGQGDKEVDARYKALVQRWGRVREHPDFHSYSAGGWVGERSPITSDALVAMSGEDLVTYLRGFVPQASSWDGPTYRGLASTLTEAVKVSEDGFASRIMLFGGLSRPYQHGLLRGLKERWSDDKRDIDWPTSLMLVQAIVSSPTFRADLAAAQTDRWEPSVHWVVSDIADLVKSASGTKRHMPADLYGSWLQVLCRVLEATPRAVGESSDAVSHAINAPRGRTLEAFIHLALAMKREDTAGDSASDETWIAVGPVLEAELSASETGVNADFATMCGLYCANFHYLNRDWTEGNFDRLFSLTNESAWNCAAQGFAYQNHLYAWLYERLIAGGHLRRMVFSEELPDRVADRAIQFLGLAYLEGMESLDGDGLLSELVVGLKVKELSALSWFFWTFRGQSEPTTRTSRVLTFWMKVVERIRETGAVLPELQSALCQLAVFVHELTPATSAALVDAAPYAQVRHHGPMLVANLERLASRNPKEVAAIFRAAMSGFLPNFRPEDVAGCVNRLAEAGEVEEAEWICNAYAERGSSLLKETYEALRAKQRSASGSAGAPKGHAAASSAADGDV
ncbi:hypothetical protein C7R54_06880 [Achromobacter aloeverae]|uniref:Uncharacterized protein n=2 Tax=Achromobacter aloeverae TaxID=1750518 RepID=A0A4Q1HRF7_9BURK|nr:hypothetical protein C7R54_06880 [Achromobacter aloeverae]